MCNCSHRICTEMENIGRVRVRSKHRWIQHIVLQISTKSDRWSLWNTEIFLLSFTLFLPTMVLYIYISVYMSYILNESHFSPSEIIPVLSTHFLHWVLVFCGGGKVRTQHWNEKPAFLFSLHFYQHLFVTWFVRPTVPDVTWYRLRSFSRRL